MEKLNKCVILFECIAKKNGSDCKYRSKNNPWCDHMHSVCDDVYVCGNVEAQCNALGIDLSLAEKMSYVNWLRT